MGIRKLVVDGRELTENQSFFIIGELMDKRIIGTSLEAQEYVKNHTIEETPDYIKVINPDYFGLSFALRKMWG